MTTAPLHQTAAPYPGDVPAGRRPGFLRAPFAAATYREVGFVLTGLPIAIAAFVVAVALFCTGLGLLVTALGLPVLALLLVQARGFGALERHRARVLLGTPVAAPAPVVPKRTGFWGTVTDRIADGAGWRAVLHQVLMFPWAVLSFAVTVTFLVTGWVVALYPLYHWVFARYTDWPGYRVYDFTTDAGRHHELYVTTPAQIAGVCALGIVLVLLTPQLVRGLTAVNRLAARGLLGGR
ncbi:sensor domain-containing protein [Kitasatospora sp. NPDC085895]|uniref:sensor domain-containing protein n=1 Tax=Kitasatospora sp. NPDC085895 TaxID=3155057 RepID=UPI00344C5E95